MTINEHTSHARRRRITAAALLVAANALVAGATLLAAAPRQRDLGKADPGRMR